MNNATHAEYFPSGSNQAGQIAGFRELGFNVGVAANELKTGGEAELARFCETGALVFVDSGAFGEVAFPADGPPVTKTLPNGKSALITDAEWDKRIGLCERLAPVLGGQLYVVAPDRVGDQVATLERLGRYAGRMRAIAAHGCRVIVPLQRGAMTAIEFDRAVSKVLGIDFVRGIPLKNAATTWESFCELAAYLPAGAAVHLLGKGPGAQAVRDAEGRARDFDAFCGELGHLEVTCDSVAIRRLVGRTNGPNRGPRAFTVAQDDARQELGLPPAFGLGKRVLGALDSFRVNRLAVFAVFGELPALASSCANQVRLAA